MAYFMIVYCLYFVIFDSIHGSVSLRPTQVKFIKFGHGLATLGTTGQFLGNRTSTTQCAIFCSMPLNIGECLAFERNANQTCLGYEAIRNDQGHKVLGQNGFAKLPIAREKRPVSKPLSEDFFLEKSAKSLTLRSTVDGRNCAELPAFPFPFIFPATKITSLMASTIAIIGGKVRKLSRKVVSSKKVFFTDITKSKPWQWEKKAPLPEKTYSQAVIVDERNQNKQLIYTFGGLTRNGAKVDKIYVYSTDSNDWRLLALHDSFFHGTSIEHACVCPGTNLAALALRQYLHLFDLDKQKFIDVANMKTRVRLLLPMTLHGPGLMIGLDRQGFYFIQANDTLQGRFDRMIKLRQSTTPQDIIAYAGYGETAMYAIKRHSKNYYFWSYPREQFFWKQKIQGTPWPVLAGLPWFTKVECDAN